MKKIVCALLALLMTVSFTGCGTDTKNSNTSNDTQKENTESIDVDLTLLSSTMVYSEVYAMMTAPEDYISKTVKMNGQFALYQATDSNSQPIPDQIYFACVIADATACCQQGMEFVLAGDYTYPDDYPELGTNITVVGEFQTYTEGQYRFCHLVDAMLVE